MNDFKVIRWIRGLRDRNAQEEKDLTIKDRLEKHRREAEPFVREFLAKHPNIESSAEPKHNAMVAEDRARYGKK